VQTYPSDDSGSWNDVVPVVQHPDFGKVLASCDFGEPVIEDQGDWVPIYEAAGEVCGLPLPTAIRALGQDLVRWRAVQGERQAEIELWLPDVVALPGARP
jgi:hypothetical protein